jgi:putative nucleotidyltransferase with HDIG domain
MPGLDGLQFIRQIRSIDERIPIIVLTGQPDMTQALEALHHGAYDYLIKPFPPELLAEKIQRALEASQLVRENILLSELVSLHEVAQRLTSTHDLREILDVTFDACLESLQAQAGIIQLVDTETGELVVVRSRGVKVSPVRSPLQDTRNWPISSWVAKNGEAVLVADGKVVPELPVSHDGLPGSSSLFAPLKVRDAIIGVIHLNRKSGSPFSLIDRNTLEVLAAQAGIAISNARLYVSLNQKLDELSLISTYSEQLIGLVERRDVVQCLIDTVRQHFPMDAIGALLVGKRQHQLLYWTRGRLSTSDLEALCGTMIEAYNRSGNLHIARKRVKLMHAGKVSRTGRSLSLPLSFTHVVPLIWEDYALGTLFFGAQKPLEHADERLTLLSSLINQTRIALANARLYGDVKENYIRTIKALAIAVDAKDTYTHGHSENVMNLAEAVAREMSLSEKMVSSIRDAGLLHDIGKIGIPGYILNKPGPLTYEEFNGIMKTHCTLGANIVRDVPFLQDLYSFILHHHEHFDGSGYPDGLRGDQIPLGARILHVVDAFEAMTSSRPYRNSLGELEAIKRLQEERRGQFDPEVVDAFVRVAVRKGWVSSEAA